MKSNRYKKYIEVFMWCVLIFGVAFPSLRYQQLTIERSEADARRMSAIVNKRHVQHLQVISTDNRIRSTSDNSGWDGADSSSLSRKLFNSTFSPIESSKKHVFKGTKDDLLSTRSDETYNDEPNLVATDTPSDWPPLESLIGKKQSKIITDVQFILDFAIIAHPKTATSNIQNWFRSHPEIQIHEVENHALAKGNPAELVSNLYDLKPGWTFKRGYKAPRDLIIGESLLAIATYWPKTNLIVGLRHPVLWFESFYNFRVHNGHKMPSPEKLIGKLKRGMVGVATDESKFHLHLDNLGKTPHSPDELKLLSWGNEKKPRLPNMTNPVFLYEVNQLRDTNETRAAMFSSDLKNYLSLKTDFQPISRKRGPKYDKAIEICESKHILLRHELMKNARESSTWIRKFFMKSPDVSVSSPNHFDALLAAWLVDPCDE